MSGEGPSRRDLFRMLGGRKPARDPAPADPAPVEGGRMVIDLSVHPIPPGRGRRFAPEARAGSVLVVRVPPDHVAAVTGDCPACGDPLAYDAGRDAVACPRACALFRLDGVSVDGRRDLRLESFLVRTAGPRIEVVLPAG